MIQFIIILGMLIQLPMFIMNKIAGNKVGMIVAVVCFLLLAVSLYTRPGVQT